MSTDNADELARYEELIPQIIDEIDLISNVNILSIFSMVDQQYKKTLDYTLKLKDDNDRPLFNILFDT